MKPVSVNIRLLSEELFVEITVMECSKCFAIVREDKMDEHMERVHS
jgi:hypothetical protein